MHVFNTPYVLLKIGEKNLNWSYRTGVKEYEESLEPFQKKLSFPGPAKNNFES